MTARRKRCPLAALVPDWLKSQIAAAEADHKRAKRLMTQAEARFEASLEAGEDQERAYERAGVPLADLRSVEAYQKVKKLNELAVRIVSHRLGIDLVRLLP